MKTMNRIEQTNNKGHFVVNFTDGLAGVGMYEKTLDDVVRIIARLDRKVKSIEWVEENA